MYFAHHPDEVLSRDNIIDHVWMRCSDQPCVVTQSISEFTQIIEDGGDSNADIVTVPKRGYKLTAVIWCEEIAMRSIIHQRRRRRRSQQ